MKKLIIIMLIMCCTLLTAKKKSPTYSNVNDIKTFSFYSGKSIGNDSLIAVNSKKNQYYVNIDKLKTNMDIYTTEQIIVGSNRLIEISKDKNYNIKAVITMKAATTIPNIQEKNFDVVNLDDSLIKAMEEKATENEKIFKETPKEDISFINIILP
ncbi:MAG: hypothetical protein KBF12_01120 [Sebaldella sp.]|nr:hypothetical protein [Sebaldella sp.]